MARLLLTGLSGLSFPGRRSRSSAATPRPTAEVEGAAHRRPSSRAVAAAPAAAPHPQPAASRFQVCLGSDWHDFGPEEDAHLRAAVAAGRRSVQMEARGHTYTCDLVRMRQVNQTTGKERAIRVVHAAIALAPAPEGSVAARPGGDAGPPASARGAAPASRPSRPLQGQQLRRRAVSRAAAGAVRGAPHAAVVDDVAPQWLHVWVPNGPTFASGAYRLLRERCYNGYPVWWKRSATPGDAGCFVYSTPTEHWAIGGIAAPSAGDGSPTTFSDGLAWVYSPVRHFGQMPDQLPRTWQHNQPEWTMDRGIIFSEVGEEDAELLRLSSRQTTASQQRAPKCRVRAIAAGASALGAALFGGAIASDALLGDGHVAAMLGDSGGKASEFMCSAF